jgi:8-oxo-dGTP diphosphatase
MIETPLIPRIGVGVVIRRGEDVLLLRRHNVHGAGTWSTPGGYFEYGETPEECAAREALEETGVTISGIRFLTITNDFFPEREKHFITLWMHADYALGDAGLHAPDEATEVGWFPHDQLPDPLFLSFANLTKSSAYLQGHWFHR